MGKKESESVAVQGKVSVIRDLGYNYMIARRKKQAGGISLRGAVSNEFSLLLMGERGTFVKLKVNASLMRGFACSSVLLKKCHVLGEKSQETKPPLKDIGGKQE